MVRVPARQPGISVTGRDHEPVVTTIHEVDI
jgi:hypothetical protein